MGTYLVTGGAGFIGANFVKYMLLYGTAVAPALSFRPTPCRHIKRLLRRYHGRIFTFHLREQHHCFHFLEHAEIVV